MGSGFAPWVVRRSGVPSQFMRLSVHYLTVDNGCRIRRLGPKGRDNKYKYAGEHRKKAGTFAPFSNLAYTPESCQFSFQKPAISHVI